ncbi:hypothetical protein N6B72_08515 [Chryseobacterium soli]|uniref:hypothetical protein n=1 Tax=Chryseobacterium soli TaxID=445961 RepID=UPI002952965C|nr:hypothetical protein [Chryseobacterium soli]MDV7696961.1 hypothetical protein [Chryseobacterium soli]
MLSAEDIYSQLSHVKNYENWDTGLNGKSAVSLFLFHYSKLKKSTEAHNKGIDLLEHELNNLESISNVSLFNGLCGIAWSVNYLASENMIDIDHDDFLPDLLESELKSIFFSNNALISDHQFKNNSDIFFYFIERYSTTQSDILKNEYEIFINRSLILFTHFFHQLDSHKLYEKLDIKNLIGFIRNLNLLAQSFQSPLLHFLFSKSNNWVLSALEVNNINLSALFQSANYITDTTHSKKLTKLLTKNNKKKVNEMTLDKINISENIGIWNEGTSNLGLKHIVFEDQIKKKSLKYLLELD